MTRILGYIFLACLLAGRGIAETATSNGFLGKGETWETPWYQVDSGKEGPVFLLVGGIHGNEPAGAIAASQIRHWPLTSGKLIVIPSANRLALDARERRFPGLSGDQGDLNRQFPRSGKPEETLSPLAAAIWDFAKKQKPDWVIDLHEGFSVNRKNSKSVGSTILCFPDKETGPLFEHCLAMVNATIPDPQNLFRLLSKSKTVDGGLVRASIERLGAKGAIFETTFQGFPLGVRVRQHRLMVHRLLRNLGMIENGVDELVFRSSDDQRIAVAIYVGPGVGGNGPAALKTILSSQPDRFISRYVGPFEIQNQSLDQFDVVIFPGGSGSKQAAGLGEAGRQNVQGFVKEGGGYVGICAGCYLACENFSWSLKILDAKTKSSKWRRGSGDLILGITESGQSLFEMEKEKVTVRYHNGPIMEPANSPDIPDFTTLALFETELSENDSPKGIQINSPAILSGTFGKGRVIGVSPHPEVTAETTHFIPAIIQWCTDPQP